MSNRELRKAASKSRDKSRDQARDSKAFSSRNIGFEISPMGTGRQGEQEAKKRREREAERERVMRKKREEDRRSQSERAEEGRRVERSLRKDEEERRIALDAKSVRHRRTEGGVKLAELGAEKSEEVDKEAKRRLQTFGDLSTMKEKAAYLLRMVSEGSTNKGTNEGKGTYDELAVARAIVAHLHLDELGALEKELSILAPHARIVIGGDMANSSMLRTSFSLKRKLLRRALEESLSDQPGQVTADPIPSLAEPAFDSKGYAQPKLKLQKLDKEELKHPIIPFKVSDEFIFSADLEIGMRSIVPSLAIFQDVFNAFTHDVFVGVDLHGSVIAGGAVMAALLPLPPFLYVMCREYRRYQVTFNKFPFPKNVIEHIESYTGLQQTFHTEFRKNIDSRFQRSPFSKSDIDVFIMADSLQEARIKLEKVYNSITNKYKHLGLKFFVVRTPNSITIATEYPYRHIQLIISTLRTIDDFLLFCDLDCTACVYDGKQVYLHPRTIRAFNKRCNLLPPRAFVNTVDKSRLVKYTQRGFSAMVFELCKHEPRCDVVLANDVHASVLSLEKEYEQREVLRARNEYTDIRLLYGPGYNLENIKESASHPRVHYCCGESLQEVMDFGDNWEEREERKEREGKEREGKEGQEEQEGRKQRDGEKMKGMRWKLDDVLRTRDADDMLPRCYTCKRRFLPKTQEQVGISLCNECIKINQLMLDRWDDVKEAEDCVALVTGARIKIGYQTALRLLRSGMTVIGVTRFPYDAANRYSKEPDYNKWEHKLHIYGVDLRHLPSVQEFITHVLQRYTRIDILINNAAQTIRRPRAYYRALIEDERRLHTSEFCGQNLVKDTKRDPFLLEFTRSKDDVSEGAVVTTGEGEASILSVGLLPFDATLPKSAALSQVKLLPMDMADRDDKAFPPGMVDEHNEQLDMRSQTSWSDTIAEVSTVELMEVQIVNSTVPFMLISSFTPLLKNAAVLGKRKRSFVVNVTSAEGVFNMNKRGIHPHTNMAKAALNMMTKSISTTCAAINIFVTAVDTGWVTKMKPATTGINERGSNPAPLQDKDGASRVLNPVWKGLTSDETPAYGVKYVNYEVGQWD